MKKGFTLMELLAVIVILAIIALIASPIVIGLIEDSNKQAAERSTEAVISAAKTLYAMHQMDATYLLETDATKLDVDNPPTDGDINYDTSGSQVVITIPATSKVVFGQYQCTYLAGEAACAKS